MTTTSDEYAESFGFTEKEVFESLEECGQGKEIQQVKKWYDGFIFGNHRGIYNPWSILNFLDTGGYTTYWANTSSNSLVSKRIREGSRGIKEDFERLLREESVRTPIDEQIVYNQLDGNEEAIWSLLLASGYLKALSYERVARDTFSYFDTGRKPSEEEPERFYHGFVLGLMVDLQDRYVITSNRESGFGRYDVMLEPKRLKEDDAIILEFKVHDPEDEGTLQDTVQAALRQVEKKQYAAALVSRGIAPERIRSYGFVFQGKRVLIG